MSVFPLFVYSSESVLTALLLGVPSGVFFGVLMGVFATRVAPEEPLPPDTGHARMREVRRLVRAGVPGADPVVNRIARDQARMLLAAPYWPRTQGALCLLSLVLNVAVLVDAHTGPGISGLRWLNLAGVALFAFLLFVLLPLTARRRRRARVFLGHFTT
ncbi:MULTISPECIES: hypothetical protein [Nocardiopsis]|nr:MULTISPECIES: hypothetical protein [Nocardiopsis]NYH52887.1 hypothetical protein [Nocardiopsis sinuspersici]